MSVYDKPSITDAVCGTRRAAKSTQDIIKDYRYIKVQNGLVAQPG